MPNSKHPLAEPKALVTSETFRFFRDLSRNNRTEWMASNRDRYKQCVVQPLRALCEELAPAVLRLDARFETSGRTGANLSRINRDIRFAKDKTPYRTGMYVKFGARSMAKAKPASSMSAFPRRRSPPASESIPAPSARIQRWRKLPTPASRPIRVGSHNRKSA